jgi:hypothetical protein
MASSIHSIPAGEREQLLTSLSNGPAFALFCDEWDGHLAGIEQKIFDPATSEADTRELKTVRQQLIKTHHPRKIIEAMIRAAHSEKIQPQK